MRGNIPGHLGLAETPRIVASADDHVVLSGRNSNILETTARLPGTTVQLPAVVRSGLARIILHAKQTPVDGEPALTGGQIETELRYYYSFYFAHSPITFDTFLAEAACQIRQLYPDVDLTLQWVRQCDRRSLLRAARRRAKSLRQCADAQKTGPMFWDHLWNLQRVFLGRFRIKPQEIGMTRTMLATMCRSQLLQENRSRVDDLLIAMGTQDHRTTKELFLSVDAILNGAPLPERVFFKDSKGYCPAYAYKAYAAAAADTHFLPQELGWSREMHALLKRRFGLDQPLQNIQPQQRTDPTAVVHEVAAVQALKKNHPPVPAQRHSVSSSKKAAPTPNDRRLTDSEVLTKLSAVLSVLFDGDEYGMTDLVADGLG